MATLDRSLLELSRCLLREAWWGAQFSDVSVRRHYSRVFFVGLALRSAGLGGTSRFPMFAFVAGRLLAEAVVHRCGELRWGLASDIEEMSTVVCL